MLIVNNTLPKAGGVWLHSMLCRMVEYRAPDENWRQPGWKSISPSEADLPRYLASESWQDENVMFKSHYSAKAIPLLQRPGIKVIVGTRDPADSALSRYHHLCREGLSVNRDEWLLTDGLKFIDGIRRLERKWSTVALMVRYERLLGSPHDELGRVMSYLGLRPLRQTLNYIIQDTGAEKMRERAGEHVRRASAGGAKDELPTDIYLRLSEPAV